MASVTVRVEGLSQLGRNLTAFSDEIKKKILRKAARVAANEVRDAAKAILIAKGLIGDEPLHVRDAIQTRRIPKASPPGKEVFAVGVFKVSGGRYAKTKHNVRKGRVGKEFGVDPPEFYWKFLEFGTVKMTPKPFLVPGFESKKHGSPQTMARELEKGMATAARRLAKAGK